MKQFTALWKHYSFVILLAFLVAGAFDPRFAIAAVICMAAPMAVAFFKGRYWCGTFCPRGSFYDQIVFRFSHHKPAPKALKSLWFRLFVVVFMLSMFGFGVYENWGNFRGIGMVFYRLIVITTIIGVVSALIYHKRTWCHFCPMGTLASAIARVRNSKRVLRVSSNCVSCKLCEQKCPFGLSPYAYQGGILRHPDCIQCGQCVAACPKKAIGYLHD